MLLQVICPCGHICGVSIKSSANARRSQPIRALISNGLSPKPVHPAVSVSVTSLQDGVFRRPLLAPSQFKLPPKPNAADAFRAQLDVSNLSIFILLFKKVDINIKGKPGKVK